MNRNTRRSDDVMRGTSDFFFTFWFLFCLFNVFSHLLPPTPSQGINPFQNRFIHFSFGTKKCMRHFKSNAH